MLFQLAYPQTRLHLLVGPYSTHCHGFLVSYDVNSDSRTSVSSISSWCSPCLPSTTSSNGATTTHAHSQHWTYSSSQYRRMESTWWATTTLLGPDQRLHWQCPHPIAGYGGGRDTYGWTGGNPSPWATPTCCRSATWCPTCTFEAFYQNTITAESQTESQIRSKGACQASSPTWPIPIPLLEPTVTLDFRRQTETTHLEGWREVSIFMEGDLDQDGQVRGRCSLYVE